MQRITEGKQVLAYWSRKSAWLTAIVIIMVQIAVVESANAQGETACSLSRHAVDKAEAYFQNGHRALDKRYGLKAERLYRKAIELNPSECRYHRQLALLLTTMSRGQEAEREACLAVSSDPEDWRSKLVLANIYHLEGRISEEIQLYKQVIDLLPKDQKDLQSKLSSLVAKQLIAERQSQENAKQKREKEESLFKGEY